MPSTYLANSNQGLPNTLNRLHHRPESARQLAAVLAGYRAVGAFHRLNIGDHLYGYQAGVDVP